jgi:hypothetical protein
MSQRTLEQRVADLERRVAELSAKVRPHPEGMTGPEFVAYMRTHGSNLGPIFDEALKLREKDREKARRKFAREDARNAAKKRAATSRQRAKT